MTLSKQYLRYKKKGVNFGIVSSSNVKIKFVNIDNVNDKYVAVAAGENIIIYDLKTYNIHSIIEGLSSHISTFEVFNKNEPLIAIGYNDGTIKVYNYETKELKCSFVGHKNAIISICFDNEGMRLATGGKDNDIAIWDIVSESGLFKLKGHKQMITKCMFMKHHDNILVTSSKDTLIKFWDLNTQHCFKTIFGHKSEIWSFVLLKNDKRLITGSNELKVFKISFKNEEDDDDIIEIDENNLVESDDEDNELIEEEKNQNLVKVTYIGSILRASKTRLVDLNIDSNERLMVCNGNDPFLECFKLRNEEEIKNHFNKKLRKMKRKLNEDTLDEDSKIVLEQNKISFKDEFQRLDPISTSSLARNCCLFKKKNDVFKVAILQNDNNFSIFDFNLNKNQTDLIASFDSFGHRSFANTISLSEDNYFILSSSKESIKLWNRSTRKCLNTVSIHEPITCSAFVPGNRFCIAGTKKGNLVIINFGSSEIIETIKASDSYIKTMYTYPNSKGIVTGSNEKSLKFWNYELVNKEKQKYLTLNLERTLDLDENVTCVCISKNMRFIAVGLLDSTVKIYYFDTLKFFLSLYGHKFPVNCIDFSSDSTLIATGSSDKNVKIWGTDFGDCHKSIFSHDETINDLKFVNDTHYYFTCSNDKTVKQWDADTFEKILTLKGHESEILKITISDDSKILVSSGKDLSFRIWEKTDEIIMIEDELDVEREDEMVKEEFLNDETIIPGETNVETGLATRKNIETLKSTEKLIEAIDIFEEELIKLKEFNDKKSDNKKSEDNLKEYQPNILFSIYNTKCPHRYILEVIKSIKTSEIEECLLCLPFNYVTKILTILTELLERNWEIELISKFSIFLARIHFGQILASSKLVPVIKKLKNLTIDKTKILKDSSGYNLSAIEFYNDQLSTKDEVTLFNEAYTDLRNKKKKRAKKFEEKVVAYHIGF